MKNNYQFIRQGKILLKANEAAKTKYFDKVENKAFIVFKATFKNISVIILWRSVLSVEETKVP